MRISISWFRRTIMVGALIALYVALVAPCAVGQDPETQKPLTNDDIVAMAKAGVSESAIVATISNSHRAFETTPAALIALKQAGVSDRIIEAMVVDTARLTASPVTPGSDTASLPSAFGYYIFADRLVELRASPVVTKFGLTLADRGMAVDGLPNNPCLRVDSSTPTLIVHQQTVNISTLRLSSLSFVESMQAYQFNILNTSPQFFSGLYKKNPTDTIAIDLWRPNRSIEIRVEPVADRPGMYRLAPSVPLQPGRYAFYAAEALHDGDIVFTASQGRQAAAFEFEIVVAAGTLPDAGVLRPLSQREPDAACDSSAQCLEFANQAVREERLQDAIPYAVKSYELGGSSAEVDTALMLLGVTAARTGDFELMEQAFDERLNRGVFSLTVCRRTAAGCDQTAFYLRRQQTGQITLELWEMMRRPPRSILTSDVSTLEVELERVEGVFPYAAVSVRSGGRAYVLIPPVWIGASECDPNAVNFICKGSGHPVQERIASYLVRKLQGSR